MVHGGRLSCAGSMETEAHRRQLLEARVDAGKPALDHLASVEQKVPAVRDLDGLGRAHRGAARVFGRAVARDKPDLRLPSKPGGERRGRTVRQEVEGTPAFEVDEDGPVGAPFAQRPVVDANNARPALRRQRQSADGLQQRRGAGGHGEVGQQPGRGCAAERQGSLDLSFCQSARPLSMTAEQVRQSLGEGAARAGRIAAVEAPDRQPQPDRFAADRQIGRLSAGSDCGRRC